MTTATGKWDATIDSALGKQKRAMVIEAGTDSFTASVSSADETHAVADNVDGSRLTWTDQVTQPMKLSLHFDVNVQGDTMTGVIKLGVFGKAKFTATRVTDLSTIPIQG